MTILTMYVLIDKNVILLFLKAPRQSFLTAQEIIIVKMKQPTVTLWFSHSSNTSTGIRTYILCLLIFNHVRIIFTFTESRTFFFLWFLRLLNSWATSFCSFYVFFIIMPCLEYYSQQHLNMLYIFCLCFKLCLYFYPLPLQILIFWFSFTTKLLENIYSLIFVFYPPLVFKILNVI